jgi:chloride channel protein, CIC family
VQIGSALASSLGQWVRMPENRLRVLVACGAAGGISATFNAPVTGVFFGVEIILRAFSVDALFTVMLSAMVADVIGREFLGSAPFLSGFPAGIALHHARTYLLIAVLAVIAGLTGLAFSKVVYLVEDLWDRLWKNRPEWARPAVGGVALGALLLAIPQMYGVGYPVMYKTVAGGYALWFLLVLAAAKITACSLTLGIGGSGGIFAPSLFIGVTSGYAFGDIAAHLFGAAAGQPALYAVVAMGAVFASAARAPLTSLASVVEMTGNFALTLPVMLAIAIATAISRALSYGTIYTTKLLRRGTDIDRAAPWRALADLKVADVMHPFRVPLTVPPAPAAGQPAPGPLAGPVTHLGDPQAVFCSESVPQALRQLEVYGHDGLPVLSADGQHVQGWVTSAGVLQEVGRQISTAPAQAGTGPDHGGQASPPRDPPAPLPGYEVIEIIVDGDSPAAGRELHDVTWPPGSTPVSVRHGRRLRAAGPGVTLAPGDRVSLLAPAPGSPQHQHGTTAGGRTTGPAARPDHVQALADGSGDD